MGYRELIDSLRKETDDKVRQLWSEAEAEAEKIRADVQTRSAHLREAYQKDLAQAVREREESVLKEVEGRVRIMKLSDEKALSERLFPIALSCLHELRSERYHDLFTALVKDLPPVQPDEVRVHPEDVQVAGEHFPHSRIVSDKRISGGMEIIMQGGTICIDNTFEKRLERSWEDLLPFIIRDIHNEAAHEKTS